MKIVRMNFEIPDDTREKVRAVAKKEGRSIKWIYLKLTYDWLKTKRK